MKAKLYFCTIQVPGILYFLPSPKFITGSQSVFANRYEQDDDKNEKN